MIDINLIAPKVQKTGFTCTHWKKHFAYDPSIILSGKRHGAYCNDCFDVVIDIDAETDDIEEVATGLKFNNLNFEQMELI